METTVRQGWLAEAYARQATATPERVAVVHRGVHVTYDALRASADALAVELRRRGARAGERIAVESDPSIETFAAALAVWSVGACCVPFDTTVPPARRAHLVGDSRATLLVGCATDRPSGEQRLHITELPAADAFAPASSTPATEAADSIACILYTSGTTGDAKGVLVTERALAHFITWMHVAFPLRPGADVALVYRPLTFIAAIWDHFGPLLQGITTVIEHEGARVDVSKVVFTATRCAVTHVSGVPSFWQAIVDMPERQLRRWRTLRLAITSGERLRVGLMRRWKRTFPQATLLNIYGLTECCRPAVFDTTGYDGVHERDDVPIGRAIGAATIEVLGDDLMPVPVGELGEICVGGASLSAGYLGRQDLDAARFVTSPRAARGTPLLFRTGDLARVDAEGRIVPAGRTDEQLKISGHRVEVGEIESALREHPGVHDAAVAISSEPSMMSVFFVPSAEAVPSSPELRAHLSTRLPEYMLPGALVPLRALPLTGTGKVDRRQLATLAASLEPVAVAGDELSTEQRFSRIVGEVTGSAAWSLEDSFLQLGGHSLLAMQVVSRVVDEFDVDLEFDILFDPELTLRQVAAKIEQLRQAQ